MFVLNVIGKGADPALFARLGTGPAKILSQGHAFDLPVADKTALAAADAFKKPRRPNLDEPRDAVLRCDDMVGPSSHWALRPQGLEGFLAQKALTLQPSIAPESGAKQRLFVVPSLPQIAKPALVSGNSCTRVPVAA